VYLTVVLLSHRKHTETALEQQRLLFGTGGWGISAAVATRYEVYGPGIELLIPVV
jgi:hypothetical protein